MFSEGRPTTCGRIEPHKVAFEDDNMTIWEAPPNGYVGLAGNLPIMVYSDTISGVIQTADGF